MCFYHSWQSILHSVVLLHFNGQLFGVTSYHGSFLIMEGEGENRLDMLSKIICAKNESVKAEPNKRFAITSWREIAA